MQNATANIPEYIYVQRGGNTPSGKGGNPIPDTVDHLLDSPYQKFSLDILLADSRIDIDENSRQYFPEIERHPNWHVFDSSIPLKVYFSREFEALKQDQKLRIRIIPKQAGEHISHDSIDYRTTFEQVGCQINLERMEYTDNRELLVGGKVIGIITGMDGGIITYDLPRGNWKKRVL